MTYMLVRHTVLRMSERNISPGPDDHLTPQEVAQILRVTDRTVLRYIADGALPAVQLPGGRLWRIRRADVDALLNAEAAS